MAKGQQQGRDNRRKRDEEPRDEFDERVVDIRRVAKVIKGGRRFAFRTVVVVGDNKGNIGIGVGKARAVPDSIRKASERARRNMAPVSLAGTTIPHAVYGRYGGAKVLLKPASPGTGVIAGGGVRAVLEVAGVHNILTKSQGSANLLNVALATLDALQHLRSGEEIAKMRGKEVHEVAPFWQRRSESGGVIMADKKLRVTLVKSPIRYSMRQKRTVQSLGLRHLQASVEIYDTPVNRGKITAVRHLVEVEEIDSNA